MGRCGPLEANCRWAVPLAANAFAVLPISRRSVSFLIQVGLEGVDAF